MTPTRLACGLLVLAGCSSSAPYVPLPEPPAPTTLATLSGPLCGENRCECRKTDDDAGTPPDGYKRFEVRLGPTGNELWASVGDMVLYKDNERGMDCFYIDLQPGTYPVELHARGGESGFGSRLAISELGTRGPWWYQTFDFSCGAPGLCDKATLVDWKRRVESFGQKHDPCGSTKIKGVTWRTGRMPDNLHPSEIVVELAMQVYRFTPEYGPGDEACTGQE